MVLVPSFRKLWHSSKYGKKKDVPFQSYNHNMSTSIVTTHDFSCLQGGAPVRER